MGQEAKIDDIDHVVICIAPYLPVAKPRAEQVCDGEESGEKPLRDDDRAPEEEPGLFQLQESEQVHPFVLSLLLQHQNNADIRFPKGHCPLRKSDRSSTLH